MSRHCVVIGAGLGGLAVAQGLRKAGFQVSVYERDYALTSRRQGYRLHLDAQAKESLRRVLPASLYELLLSTSHTPEPRFTAVDEQLNVVFTRQDDGEHLAVDRLVLRQILLTGLADAVHFGADFDSYQATPDGRITVCFADGNKVTGDMLIAADGINSTVRAQYLPYARIVDTGVHQIYGKVVLTDETRDLFDDTMNGIFTTIRGSDGPFIGVAPVRFPVPPHKVGLQPTDNYMTWSFGARREWFGDNDLRTMTGTQLHGIMADAVRTWHPRVQQIVDHCDPASLFALPLRTSVPIPAWTSTRVTLLGDAIHAMSPAAGAGACTALRDASRLTEALTTEPDLLTAISAYEKDMVDYGFDAVRTGGRNGERFLGQDPLPTR